MGIFHMKKGIKAVVTLPEKSKLKESRISVCMKRSATFPTCFARMASITPRGRTSLARINCATKAHEGHQEYVA